jgi:hypothetical protein
MSFYPQCGFLALGTLDRARIAVDHTVSIRNADFWLWERSRGLCEVRVFCKFLSAMRIFGFGNSPPFLGH